MRVLWIFRIDCRVLPESGHSRSGRVAPLRFPLETVSPDPIQQLVRAQHVRCLPHHRLPNRRRPNTVRSTGRRVRGLLRAPAQSSRRWSPAVAGRHVGRGATPSPRARAALPTSRRSHGNPVGSYPPECRIAYATDAAQKSACVSRVNRSRRSAGPRASDQLSTNAWGIRPAPSGPLRAGVIRTPQRA